MGLFDFLLGKREVFTEPDALKSRLFEAANQGDHAALKRLCSSHLEMLRAHFKAWSKVPEAERKIPERVKYYGTALTSILSCIECDLGRADLIPELIGTPEDNPYMRLQKRMQHAQHLSKEMKYEETIKELNDILIDGKGYQGDAIVLDRAIAYGLMGQCHLHMGAAEKAVAPLQHAIDFCRQLNDREGVQLYLQNLYETQRYLGDGKAITAASEDLVKLFEDTAQTELARRQRKLTQLVREGEPLNRTVLAIGGQKFEVDEVSAFPTNITIKFEFVRNRIELVPSEKSCEAGAALGAKKQFEDALACFRDAQKADSFAPHSRYEAGFTLAHLQRHSEALESFEAAERLAPGWFFVRSDIWLMQQLCIEKISHELYLALRMLEDFGTPSEVELVENLLKKFPAVARLNLVHGNLLGKSKRPNDAAVAFRRGMECESDIDTRCCLMLQLATGSVGVEKKDTLLKQIVELDGNLNATATAKILLKK